MRPISDALPQPQPHRPPVPVAKQGTGVTGASSFLQLFLCSIPSPWAIILHQDESGPTHQGRQQVGQSWGQALQPSFPRS